MGLMGLSYYIIFPSLKKFLRSKRGKVSLLQLIATAFRVSQVSGGSLSRGIVELNLSASIVTI